MAVLPKPAALNLCGSTGGCFRFAPRKLIFTRHSLPLASRPSFPHSKSEVRFAHIVQHRRTHATHAAAGSPIATFHNAENPLKPIKLTALCIASAAVWAFVAASHPGSVSNFASLTIAAEASKGAYLVAAQSAWAGLAAGFLHTLCGPDHLAALTPLTIGRNRASASLLGALWGFGHSTGQLILGLVFVLLKDRFHDFVPALSKWAGVIVGLTLLAIGFMGIYETMFHKADEDEEHLPVNLAVTTGPGGAATVSQASVKTGLAIYATGIVYGLQPDALFVVIPALALPTKLAAIAYCIMFVFGTVTAMGGYTALIGTTSAALVKERPWLQSHLSTIASGIAILVGGLILAAGLGVNVPFFS